MIALGRPVWQILVQGFSLKRFTDIEDTICITPPIPVIPEFSSHRFYFHHFYHHHFSRFFR